MKNQRRCDRRNIKKIGECDPEISRKKSQRRLVHCLVGRIAEQTRVWIIFITDCLQLHDVVEPSIDRTPIVIGSIPPSVITSSVHRPHLDVQASTRSHSLEKDQDCLGSG